MLVSNAFRTNETVLEFIERVLNEFLKDRKEVVYEAIDDWFDRQDLPWYVPGFAFKRLSRWLFPDRAISLIIYLLQRVGVR